MHIKEPKKGYKLVKSYFRKYEEIPSDWKYDELKNNSKITDGAHNSPEKVLNGFPMATVENIRSNEIDVESCYRISKKDYDYLVQNNCKPEKGDILFTKDGTVGKSLVFNQKDNVVLLSSIAIISPNANLDSEFCNYALQSKFMDKHIAKYLGGTAIKRIILKHLGKFEFPLPLIQEQQKIASILSNIDSLIQQTQNEIEQTQNLKKGLMQRLLLKGIGHTKFKKVKSLFRKYQEIPEDWDYVNLNSLTPKNDKSSVRMGPFGSSLKIEELLDSGKIMTIWIENIVNNEFSWEYQKFITEQKYEQLKGFTVKPDDVLITMMGTLGRVAIVPKDIGIAIISSHLLKITLDQNKAIPLFMYYFLKSNFVLRQIIKESRGLVMGGLNTGIIRSLMIITPKIQEQQKIASILSNVDSQIHKQIEKKSNLENLKKGLMQKLLTGQIRVKV